jgi:REP element-mobilizing transposase RayT
MGSYTQIIYHIVFGTKYRVRHFMRNISEFEEKYLFEKKLPEGLPV